LCELALRLGPMPVLPPDLAPRLDVLVAGPLTDTLNSKLRPQHH
jgi:hypothetical protein